MTQCGSPQNQFNRIDMKRMGSDEDIAVLFHRNKLLNAYTGNLALEHTNKTLAHITRILDIGCGPGVWVHDVASTYPSKEVIGIDSNSRMITSARAHTQDLPNTRFHTMDALQPLDFPDEHFDMINACSMSSFVSAQAWPQVLTECQRILRHGGILRLSEREWAITNKPACEMLIAAASQALYTTKHSFSPIGQHLGITAMLSHLLRDAGFHSITHKAYALDSSFGMPLHDIVLQDLHTLFTISVEQSIQSTAKDDIEGLYKQAVLETQSSDFCMVSFLLTAWGKKR